MRALFIYFLMVFACVLTTLNLLGAAESPNNFSEEFKNKVKHLEKTLEHEDWHKKSEKLEYFSYFLRREASHGQEVDSLSTDKLVDLLKMTYHNVPPASLPPTYRAAKANPSLAAMAKTKFLCVVVLLQLKQDAGNKLLVNAVSLPHSIISKDIKNITYVTEPKVQFVVSNLTPFQYVSALRSLLGNKDGTLRNKAMAGVVRVMKKAHPVLRKLVFRLIQKKFFGETDLAMKIQMLDVLEAIGIDNAEVSNFLEKIKKSDEQSDQIHQYAESILESQQGSAKGSKN